MAEKSWRDKLRVDTGPVIARASEDGDRMYRGIGRFLGLDIAPEVGVAPGPMASWIQGTPIAFDGVQPMGPEPALVPFGMPLGPAPAPIVAVAKPSGKKPMTKAEADQLLQDINAVQQPKPPAMDLTQLPTLNVSDLLPDQEKIAEVMKSMPFDVRPIAAMMDSVYGTKAAQATPDIQADMLSKIKAAQSMMGYSPALQQVIGQGRLEEFKAKLEKVMGAEDRDLKERRMALEEWRAKDESKRGWADISERRLKAQIDQMLQGRVVPKARQRQIEDIEKKIAGFLPIRSELAAALRKLKDPNTSKADKVRIGQGLPKAMNSIHGADATGVEEAKRAIGELITSYGEIGQGIKSGATTGAIGGAALSAIPSAGIATPAGAAIGGVAGGILGGLAAAADEASKPGGIRFTPDTEGFTQRVDLHVQKLDELINRQERMIELLIEGYSVVDANKIIDAEQQMAP